VLKEARMAAGGEGIGCTKVRRPVRRRYRKGKVVDANVDVDVDDITL
jgi:hypothetical protein